MPQKKRYIWIKSDTVQKEETHPHAIAVIGLGYVGYPLFCSISQFFECWGMDIDECRIKTLSKDENLINGT